LDFEVNLTVGLEGPSSLEFQRDRLHGKVDELDEQLRASLNADMAVTSTRAGSRCGPRRKAPRRGDGYFWRRSNGVRARPPLH
jgi:hypothetical protein